MKTELYYQRQRRSPMTHSFCQYKGCADIRGGSRLLERGRQTTVG